MLIQISCELNELSCIISGPLLLNNRNPVLEIRPFYIYPNQNCLDPMGQLAIQKQALLSWSGHARLLWDLFVCISSAFELGAGGIVLCIIYIV